MRSWESGGSDNIEAKLPALVRIKHGSSCHEDEEDNDKEAEAPTEAENSDEVDGWKDNELSIIFSDSSFPIYSRIGRYRAGAPGTPNVS